MLVLSTRERFFVEGLESELFCTSTNEPLQIYKPDPNDPTNKNEQIQNIARQCVIDRSNPNPVPLALPS